MSHPENELPAHIKAPSGQNKGATSPNSKSPRITDLQELLRQSYWSNLIVDGLESALFSLDRDWHFTYLNNWATNLWQRSKEDLLGKIIWEEFPGLVDTNLEKYYRQTLEEAIPNHFEEFSPVTQTWYEVQAYPIEQGMIVQFHNIDARKKLEQALKESEERYKALSEATFEAIVMHRDGIIVEANQTASQLAGYDSLEEYIGQPLLPMILPEELQMVQKRIAENSLETYESAVVRKDGSRFPVEVRAKSIEYRGQPVRVAVFRDISERKLKEQQLRESEYRFKVLSGATSQGIFIHRNGTIVDANESLAHMSGFNSAQELIGRSLFEIVAPESHVELKRRVAEGSEESFELTGLRQDGTRFPIEVWGKTIEYQGQPARQVAVTDMTERKRKEQQMRESEYRYKVLSEATSEGIVIHRDGIIIEANDSNARIFGYTSGQELIGRSAFEFIAPESLEQVRQRVEQRSEELYEVVGLKKDGTRIILENQGKNIEYQGQPARQLTFRDISERKLKEQQVRESQYRYKVLSQATHEGIIIHRNGTIIEANHSITSMLGFASPKQLQGRNYFEISAPETRAALQKYDTEGNEEIYELIGLRQNGTHFPLEIQGKNIKYKGQPTRQVVLRDITELRQREQALRDSEERYRILSEASYEGLIISAGGAVLEANQRMATMFGYSLEEFIGLPVAQLVIPEAFEVLQERIAHNRTEPAEFIGVRKDGSHFYHETRGSIIEYKGRPTRVIAVRDLTEIKQAQADLLKIQQQLAQSQKMEGIGRLAGGIAHDFNNILTAITGYTDLILFKLKEGDPFYQDMLEIEKAAERATNLTRQLLAFSRQQILQPRKLNLNKIVTEMNKFLQRLIEEDIELGIELDHQLGEIVADPSQIEQVIINLVVNARDAMPKGGKLTIETANVELDETYQASGYPHLKTGPYVMVAISDTGTGMDKATQERIFEPFFTTKEQGKGTGLGLATVYGIMEQSGGHILVYSEVDIGTTFKIYLPRLTSTEELAVSPALPVERGAVVTSKAAQDCSVLVVEDDNLVGDLIQRVLSEADYTLLRARNGKEALELVSRHSSEIKIVLTDMVMPQMGGQELVAQLKAQQPYLKVIFMSGYTDRAIEQQGAITQSDGFLQKPFTPQILLGQIEALLAERPLP